MTYHEKQTSKEVWWYGWYDMSYGENNSPKIHQIVCEFYSTPPLFFIVMIKYKPRGIGSLD